MSYSYRLFKGELHNLAFTCKYFGFTGVRFIQCTGSTGIPAFSNKYTHRLTLYWLKGDSLEFIVFMPQLWKSWRGILLSACPCVRASVPGGGGVLWYIHTYVGSGYFLGFKILIFNIFGVFQKNDFFLIFGVWRFCGYFWGVITKLGYISGSFLCILGSFLKVKVQNGDIFGSLKFQFFGGAWNFWYFLGWMVNTGPEPTYAEKMRVPPWAVSPCVRYIFF